MAARPDRCLRRRPRKFRRALVDELIDFAAHQFELGRADDKGNTLRDHLESAAKQTGKRSPALDGPPLPDALAYLWRWFIDLSRGRQPGAYGPARLTWPDLAAWLLVTGTVLEPWELRALLDLDNAYLAAHAAATTPPPQHPEL